MGRWSMDRTSEENSNMRVLKITVMEVLNIVTLEVRDAEDGVKVFDLHLQRLYTPVATRFGLGIRLPRIRRITNDGGRRSQIPSGRTGRHQNRAPD